MKILTSVVFVLGLGLASAQAMPIQHLEDTAPAVAQTIGWRCGAGWHVNRWGRCVPSRAFYAPRAYYGGPVYGARWHHRHWRRW